MVWMGELLGGEEEEGGKGLGMGLWSSNSRCLGGRRKKEERGKRKRREEQGIGERSYSVCCQNGLYSFLHFSNFITDVDM